MMIADFNERPAVPASQTGVERPRQCHQGLRGTLVERVCSFLDRYQLSHSDGEGNTPSSRLGHRGLPNRR